MPTRDLTEVELTIREVRTRDRDTDEVKKQWQVEHDAMEHVIREDTPREALEVFGQALETDNESARIDLEDLQKEPEPLA